MQHAQFRRKDIAMIRGDHFAMWVGLAQGWQEVSDAPASYEGRLVLRELPDDAAADELVMTSTLVEGEDDRFPNMTHMLHFTATPAQTQALPDWDLSCFCELRSLDGTFVRRLFDGRVQISD